MQGSGNLVRNRHPAPRQGQHERVEPGKGLQGPSQLLPCVSSVTEHVAPIHRSTSIHRSSEQGLGQGTFAPGRARDRPRTLNATDSTDASEETRMSTHTWTSPTRQITGLHSIKGRHDDYDGLLELVGDRRFVLIGEASHGTHDFYRERARITERLIEEKGFAAVVVEADWPDAYRVNRYVRGRSMDPDASAARPRAAEAVGTGSVRSVPGSAGTLRPASLSATVAAARSAARRRGGSTTPRSGCRPAPVW